MQKQDIGKWIRDGIVPDTITAAQKFGESIKDSGLTTSQIRQVFTRLKSIEAKGYAGNKVQFLMLKPMLAYAAGRSENRNKKGLQEFRDCVTWAIDAVTEGDDAGQEQRFKNFCSLFEAILSYHRAAGGK